MRFIHILKSATVQEETYKKLTSSAYKYSVIGAVVPHNIQLRDGRQTALWPYIH